MRATCTYILHTHLTSKWCFFSPLEPIGPRLLQATSLSLAAMFPPCSCVQSIFYTRYNSQCRICHNSIATWFQQTSTTERYYKLSQKSIQIFTEIAMHIKTMYMQYSLLGRTAASNSFEYNVSGTSSVPTSGKTEISFS
jgi:hypothetical protein